MEFTVKNAALLFLIFQLGIIPTSFGMGGSKPVKESGEYKSLLQEKKGLDAEAVNLKESIKNNESTILLLRNNIESLKLLLGMEQESSKALQGKLEGYKKDKIALEGQISNLNLLIGGYEKSLEEKTKELSEKQAKIQDLEIKLKNLEEESSSHISSLQDEIDKLNQDFEESLDEISRLQEEMKILKEGFGEQIAKLESELQKERDAKSSLESQIVDLNNKLDDAQIQLDEYRMKVPEKIIFSAPETAHAGTPFEVFIEVRNYFEDIMTDFFGTVNLVNLETKEILAEIDLQKGIANKLITLSVSGPVILALDNPEPILDSSLTHQINIEKVALPENCFLPGVSLPGLENLPEYRRINVIGHGNSTGVSWSSYNDPRYSSSYTNTQDSIFVTDAKFDLRVVAKSPPGQGIIDSLGEMCNFSGLPFSKIKFNISIRDVFSSSPFHTQTVELDVEKCSPILNLAQHLPQITEPIILEISDVKTDYPCAMFPPGTSEYNQLNCGTNQFQPLSNSECFELELQLSTDETKDLPGTIPGPQLDLCLKMDVATSDPTLIPYVGNFFAIQEKLKLEKSGTSGPQLDDLINSLDFNAKVGEKATELAKEYILYFDSQEKIKELTGQSLVGFCARECNKIVIDKDWWDSTSDDDKKIMVLHQLGHCYLKRNHTAAGVKSIMEAVLIYPSQYSSDKDFYDNELFYGGGGGEPVPEPEPEPGPEPEPVAQAIQRELQKNPCPSGRSRFEVRFNSTSAYLIPNNTQIGDPFNSGHIGGNISSTYVGMNQSTKDFMIAYKVEDGTQTKFNISLMICPNYTSNQGVNYPLLASERPPTKMSLQYGSQTGQIVLNESTNCPFGSVNANFSVEVGPWQNLLPAYVIQLPFSSVCY